MLSVFETGEASFRLSDRHDEDVGWIRGGTLGFDGFASEADAIAAAVAGSEALRRHLDRINGSVQPTPAPTGRTRVVHDGAYEWVSRGTAPLARLFRPARAGAPPKHRGHAVEFVLPSYVKAGSVITAAQVVHHAIATRATSARAVERAAAMPAATPIPTHATGAAAL